MTRPNGTQNPEDAGPTTYTEAAEKKLLNLKVITPLSLLVLIATFLVSILVARPGSGEINDQYETVWSPRKFMIGIYWLVMLGLQIGFCLLLVLASKEETRRTLLNSVGYSYPLANILMCFWALFWELKFFLISEVFLGLTFILLAKIWIGLLRHPASFKRPLDFVFIHITFRLYLLVLFNVDLLQNLLLALKWYKYTGPDEGQDPDYPGPDYDPDQDGPLGQWEKKHDEHAWIVFAVVFALGMVNAGVVFLGRDVVWAGASIYLYIAELLKPSNKPPQIFIPTILLAALQLVALIASLVWHRMAREGAIRLPEDEEGAQLAEGGEGSAGQGRTIRVEGVGARVVGGDGQQGQVQGGQEEGPREIILS